MKIEELAVKVSKVAPLSMGELTKKSLLENVDHFFSEEEEILYVGHPPISTLDKVLFFTNKQVLWFSAKQKKCLQRFETNQIDKILIKHAYSECYLLYLSDKQFFEFKISHKDFAKSFTEKLKEMFPNKVAEANSSGKTIINKLIKYSLISFVAMIVISLIIVKIEDAFNIDIFPDTEANQPYYKTPSASYVVNQVNEKVIPGITPGEFYVNFTQRGFSKVGPRKIAANVDSPNAGKYTWNLSRTDVRTNCIYDIDIYGPHAASMDKILASLVCPNTNDLIPNANTFFPFVASLNYEGSQVDQAIQWVKSKLGSKYIETSIGQVKFKLKQDSPKSIYLYIEI